MAKIMLDLSKIDLNDDRFRISYLPPSEKLLRSIREVGLINPPHVTQRQKKMICVSGWKRIAACLKTGMASIPVVPVDEQSDLNIFFRVLYENYAEKEFNDMHRAEILMRLVRFGGGKERLIKEFLPLLGIPPLYARLAAYLKIAEFDVRLKQALDEKKTPFAVLSLLADYSSGAREKIVPYILAMGQNKQKEFLEDLMETARRDGCEPEEILKDRKVRTVLTNKNLSLVQKADKMRRIFREKRYPHLSLWEKSFTEIKKCLEIPGEISVEASRYFEGEDVFIRFSFKTKKEFLGHLSKLKDLASDKEFSKIIKPCPDE